MEVLGHFFSGHRHLNIDPVGRLVENDVSCEPPSVGNDTHEGHELPISSILSEHHFEIVPLKLVDERL